MKNKLHTLIQYIVPHHALSRLGSWIANCRWHWLKTWIIRDFIQRYQVDLHLARFEKIEEYENFNRFFTRLLKSEHRPIVQGKNDVASPVDGNISQIGTICEETLFQAKGFDFSLTSLLGGDVTAARSFYNGKFATFYLAPRDYHRVHMPYPGRLRTTIFIPGKLFSVNPKTVQTIPQLFARNERLVCLFDTDIGPMAVILVGAMLVGSIKTVWSTVSSSKTISVQSYPNPLILERGAELGHFEMGSTVIILFAKEAIEWANNLKENASLQMGQLIATVASK